MSSNYARGRALEYRIIHEHLRLGACFAQRFAGSHSVWDGVSVFPVGSIVFWQAKLRCKPSRTEWRAMRAFRKLCPNAKCLVITAHAVNDVQHMQDVV